jgi:hypothetical protein
MRFVRQVSKARLQSHTHHIFQCSIGYANAPKYYDMSTLPVLVLSSSMSHFPSRFFRTALGPCSDRPGAHPASYSLSTGFIFTKAQKGYVVKLNTHLHLGPRVRTNGAIPPLPLYVFPALTKTTQLYRYLCLSVLILLFFLSLLPSVY